MKDTFGKDVEFYPINRSLLSSTNYTILFISTVKNGTHCKENEMLVSSVNDNKTQMYQKKSCDDDDDDENSKVIRVKLTFTFICKGKVFNPYVTVSGLT